jgi:hypothetical protein
MKLNKTIFTILSIFILFVAGHSVLAYDLTETFDNYNLSDQILDQPNWQDGTANCSSKCSKLIIANNASVSSPYALRNNNYTCGACAYWVPPITEEILNYDILTIDLDIYTTTIGSGVQENFTILGNSNNSLGTFRLYVDKFYLNSSDLVSIIEDDIWYHFKVQFKESDNTIRGKLDSNDWTDWQTNVFEMTISNFDNIQIHQQGNSYIYIDNLSIAFDNLLPPFAITSPQMDGSVLNDSWIMVEGVCPTDGVNQIAFTNDCSNFSNLDYTVDCVGGIFSDEFYYNGISDWVVAVDKNSVAGDCVDYDDLMDGVRVNGFDIIEGYPDDWYFNFDYYDDYDIKINYPVFSTALTLPKDTANSNFSFNFIYPNPLAPNLTFKILQYDDNGNILNGNYHSINLIDMPNTSDYQVNITASSTENIHYVVQLYKDTDIVRQYPFMVAISDLDIIINIDDFRYLFPRLVEELKTKVVFNYYFAFHDGFYNMFNASTTAVSNDALDITFQSVSDNNEYNLPIKIFSASDERVQKFAGGMRPYITAILWLIFASYVIFRVTHLFSDNQ